MKSATRWELTQEVESALAERGSGSPSSDRATPEPGAQPKRRGQGTGTPT